MIRLLLRAALLSVLCDSVAFAQMAPLRIEVRSDGQPLADADVTVNRIVYRTDAEGRVVVSVPAGALDIVVTKEGFAPSTASVQLQSGQELQVVIDLKRQLRVEEQVTVSATRTDRRLQDEAMRIEVLSRKELEEKLMMTPGDIAMTLNEMGGIRVQTTSPTLGAASIRIQGMRGRYTRVLADGLPLFGDQVQGLGLLQIPPMDLGQVEVIKGVASALYGAGAVGGVINLISRRPGKAPARELLVNRTTRGGTDTVFYGEMPLTGQWSMSVLGGGHWHEQTDVNGDAWADLPSYSRGVVRPRLFWDDGRGRTFFATLGATYEDRAGGTLSNATPSVVGFPYREAVETARLDGGAVGQFLVRDRVVVTARGALNRQRHNQQFGDVREHDTRQTGFGELAARSTAGRHTWVVGTALERASYSPRDLPHFAYTFTIPGIFAQDEIDVTRWLAVAGSARLDHHSAYGTFVSPRASALLRLGEWATRLSGGTGFFGPTVLTEETEAVGLSRLHVPGSLVAERARSMSVDVGRTIGPASMNISFFESRVRDPIHVERSSVFLLSNQTQPTTNRGLEVLGTLEREPLEIAATYTYVRSRESERGLRVDVPLTPRHSLAAVAIVELEGRGRVGIEGYYTGRQRLEENPYRSVAPGYVIMGALAELRFGRLRLFVNAENLTDKRQSRWDPLLLPQRAA
ncbi:MAG TPA: TonB-dependent receptor, partial [Vicinamibacterales bacterium]|nr:TonB-dependent receptor [Vicinamibacterales bacterium]